MKYENYFNLIILHVCHDKNVRATDRIDKCISRLHLRLHECRIQDNWIRPAIKIVEYSGVEGACWLALVKCQYVRRLSAKGTEIQKRHSPRCAYRTPACKRCACNGERVFVRASGAMVSRWPSSTISLQAASCKL